MSYYRKLHIQRANHAIEEWNYHVGKSYIHIRGPNSESLKPTSKKLLGHDYDLNDENVRFAITPDTVKAYIIAYLAD